MTDRPPIDKISENLETGAPATLGAPRAKAPIARPKQPEPETQTAPPEEPPAPKRRLAVRHPKAVIIVWAIAALILGVAGLFAKQVLHAEDLVIKGTPSAKALAADKAAFGESTPLMIMLDGPAAALDSAGPALVKELNALPGVQVASPWSAGAPLLMRETPNRALLIASLDKPVVDAGRETLPQVNEALADLPDGVTAHVAGQSRFSTELVNLVFAGALKAEIVALPFLLLILLLIFRAPIAAAIPLVQGLAVIGVTTGAVTVLGLLMPVNILAQASGSIIGLALGVDYSLLFVSRFRDELRSGKSVEDAVSDSLSTAGRTIIFAGGILVLAGLVVIGVSFGWASMTTGTIGVAAAAIFSVLAAFTLLPACLLMIGHRIDKWPIGTLNPKPRAAAFVNRVLKHPVLATTLALIPLLILCAAALGLKTGGPDLKMFKSDNPMRVDTEAVADQYGGGVMAPYEVISTSPSQPLTSPSDVRALGKFQAALAADPAVRYVIGLGTNRVKKLTDTTEKAPGDLAKLDVGLGAASTGAKKVTKGLNAAGSGAGQLAAANNAALGGARQLANGFSAAQAGAGQLEDGLSKSASGSRQLDSAIAQLKSGTAKLNARTKDAKSTARGIYNGAVLLRSFVNDTGSAINSISAPTTQAVSAIDSAIAAIDGLPAADQSDPAVQSARSSLNSARNTASNAGSGIADAAAKNDKVRGAVDLGIGQASEAKGNAAEFANAIATLNSGVGKISESTGTLTSGLGQLSSGSSQLKNGLAPLAGGSQQLANGLGSLSAGSSSLSSGLTSGSKQSKKLSKGLADGKASIAEIREQANAQGAVDLKKVGKSPYLTMALLSAAPAAQKQNLRLVLNEENGGTATRSYIFTRELPTDKSIAPFNERLNEQSQKLGKKLDAEVAVGGAGRTYLDYDHFTSQRIMILLAALSLMSFLFLLVAFRSVLLAAKAVVLNLITVGAAMGLVALLYGGDQPLFGGPGWMEATSFFVVYSTTFALSMDYEIFMINSMRENYVRTGSNERAIRAGISKTARIVTGSALVMCVLFVAMAFTTELVSSAQLGLGLAFAIAIDATLVRLVLLPATMKLFGAANWWYPSWLGRVTPNVAIH